MIHTELVGMLRLSASSPVIMRDITVADIGHPRWPHRNSTQRDLERDVRENGVREPVTIGPGYMITGRHRYMAARDTGQEMMPVEFSAGRDDRALHAVSAWQDPRGIPVFKDWV